MTVQELGQVIEAATSPGRFYIGSGGTMHMSYQPATTVRWEVFRGHLLDASQTRESCSFAVWDLIFRWPDDESGQPLVSLLFDNSTEVVHVTRSILVYGWEPYEPAPNVIESREVRLWRRELVGSVHVGGAERARIEHELTQNLHLAIVGTSRLPITSLESPLPAFSLGRLAYFDRLGGNDGVVTEANSCATRSDELLARLAAVETVADQARLLEVVLRAASTDESPRLAACFFDRWMAAGRPPAALPQVVRTMFGQLALSPYTGIGERLVAVLETWAMDDRLGPAVIADLLGYMLRHLVRHLTAFDLVTFHHRGANYPDALLLDVLLKAFLRLIAKRPDLFADPQAEPVQVGNLLRLRRRALRQAWLVRKLYEGHLVPETPTSPGENLRVLPAGMPRIADDELLYPGKRHKTLYSGDPIENWLGETARAVLDKACANLSHAEELKELGMATYLDRPLGSSKEPGEVDRTPLLSYEAFSPAIVIDRLRQLRRWGAIANDAKFNELAARVHTLSIVGLPAANLRGRNRPGVVALEDAHKMADDFVFLRTTTQSLREFCSHFDWRPLIESHPQLAEWLRAGRDVLLIRDTVAAEHVNEHKGMMAFDHEFRPRAEMSWSNASGIESGWTIHKGVELPRVGMNVHIPGAAPAATIRLPYAEAR